MMRNRNATINLSEKLGYKYVQVLEGNHVVLLMPVSRSREGIATDNTCQATSELKDFFGQKAGAAKSLKSMSDHLKFDIFLLERYLRSLTESERSSIQELLLSKKKRLSQVESYLEGLSSAKKHGDIDALLKAEYSPQTTIFNSLFNKTIEEGGTLCSMILSPDEEDDWLRSPNVIFSLQRESLGEDKSPFHEMLMGIDYPAQKTLQAKVKEQIGQIYDEIAAQDTNKSFQDIITGLQKIQELDGEPYATGYIGRVLDAYTGSEKEFLELIVQDKPEEKDAVVYFLFEALNIDWDERRRILTQSIFESPQNDEAKIKFSNMVQFYMGIINIFLYLERKTKCNMGLVLEGDMMRVDFAGILKDALQEGRVEQAILKFINHQRDKFNISAEMTDSDQKAIIQQFHSQYLTVKEAPYFDEFMTVSLTKKGLWREIDSRIVCPFSAFMWECLGQKLLGDIQAAEMAYLDGKPLCETAAEDIEIEVTSDLLRVACSTRDEKVALRLLETESVQANAAASDNEALREACYYNMKEVALELLKIECVKANAAAEHNMALYWACYNNMKDVALELLKFECIHEKVAVRHNEELRLACENNMQEVALELLKIGSVRDNVAVHDNNALRWACINNMKDVALELLKIECVKANAAARDNEASHYTPTVNVDFEVWHDRLLNDSSGVQNERSESPEPKSYEASSERSESPEPELSEASSEQIESPELELSEDSDEEAFFQSLMMENCEALLFANNSPGDQNERSESPEPELEEVTTLEAFIQSLKMERRRSK